MCPQHPLHACRVAALVAVTALLSSGAGPVVNPELLNRAWTARWIAPAKAPPFEYGVYHFRKSFDLPAKPEHFVVHVTGDNRYQLFVNGERVLAGPARGDLFHWRFETADIAPHLRAGKNVLAAVVWNFGQYAPEAQVTSQTGLLLQGDTQAERIADTGATWRAARNPAYEPIPITHGEVRGYFVAGPGERINAASYPWGWERADFDDASWPLAVALTPGAPRDASDGPNRWMLVPRSIPLMEETSERIATLRKASGVAVPATFPKQPTAWTVPANTKAHLLLDQSYLTTAYPELIVSEGKGASISVGYAEALVEEGNYPGPFRKGNRNEIEGKRFVGQHDEFVADGGANRMFRPLWWRTWRYLDLNIETKDAPLIINDFRGVYTAYPFERTARFDAGSEELSKILDVGWRTARLCAHETYMDCPYYEQLQYVGDTRIQALVSLYMTGDGRLVRNAIEQINDSRTAEGATFSRFPSRQQQYIPGFSLWWIGMVHDYWRYQDDQQFVREMLPGVRAVLSFYQARQKENGSIGKMPWWNYVDWVNKWTGGVPPHSVDHSSAPQDLQLLLAYRWATELENALGSKTRSAEYGTAADSLATTIQRLYWDEGRKLYADTPDKKDFSQQTNTLAILGGLVKDKAAADVMDRIIADKSLTPASIYFRHYLHTALNQVGEGDRYLEMLDIWRDALARGLTTFPETVDPSRSDCHAWSASPNYELFHTVLGIDSAGPGFSRVLIRPFPGKLTHASGSIRHPKGEVAVDLRANGNKLVADVTLPPGIPGEFVWKNIRKALTPGKNHVEF